jgi:hypothetical protein
MGTVDTSQLHQEILDAPLIVVALSHISSAGTNVTVYFKASLDSGSEAALDAVVAAHVPVPTPAEMLKLDAPYDISGRPIVATGHKVVDESFRRKGYRFDALPGTVTFFDVEVSHQIYLQSGDVRIMPNRAQRGDYIDFSVVDKNDVMGYFAMFGLTVGVDVLELKKFVSDEHVIWWDSGGQVLKVEPGTVSLLVPGLFLRCVYHSIEVQGREAVPVLLGYNWFEV